MQTDRTRRPGEVVFTLFLVALGGAALWEAVGISGFSGMATPGVFPMLAAGAMVLSALVILRATLRRPRPDDVDDRGAGAFFRDVLPMRQRVLFGIILAYMLALPWAGFVVASCLFLFVAIQYLWRKPVWVSLVLTGAMVAVIHLLFRVVFQVVLPQGSLLRGLF